MVKVSRRFIAGAICPVCQLIDKVYVEKMDGVGEKIRGCVSCGFKESLEKLESQSRREESNQSAGPRPDSDKKTIRFIIGKGGGATC